MSRFILPAALAFTMLFAAPVYAQSSTAPVDTPGAISAPTVGQVMSSTTTPADAGYTGYGANEAIPPGSPAPIPVPAAAPAAAPATAAAPTQPMAPNGAPADPAVAQQPPALPPGQAPLNPALNPQPPLPAPTAPATIDPAALDPCKDFMTSHAAYVMCQDREKKYQRIRDQKAARNKSFQPPPKEEKKDEKKDEKKAETPATPPPANPTSGSGAGPAGAGLNVGTPATPPPAGMKVDTNTGALEPAK